MSHISTQLFCTVTSGSKYDHDHDSTEEETERQATISEWQGLGSQPPPALPLTQEGSLTPDLEEVREEA